MPLFFSYRVLKASCFFVHLVALMRALLLRTALFAFLFCGGISAQAQEFLNERTMKLMEVSRDSSYGYEPDNPIKIGRAKHNMGFYLNALKGPRDLKFHVDKIQYKIDEKRDTLTQVDLSFEGYKNAGAVTLFFLPKQFEQPKAPLMFRFKTVADLPVATRFPTDKIVKATACTPKNLFAPAADSPLSSPDMLAKRLGTLPPQPDSYPVFTGGKEALQKYFDAHPLTSEMAQKAAFMTSILFLVTCEGKAGGYLILADVDGRGEFETLVNQVLGPVNEMPQQWKPATKRGKPVDSYQILKFLVAKGKITNVTYQ
ncbi:hypothetical protein [Hymenobacter cellulosilyticus]|uniref:Uncharacterized protein n=1 Tax=Hymenobacter cellulosilyticus TaxID=2932248 RepID=A0A8T9Q8Y6_9BACT|nr:hypothetical protein [Hymenobacter cellulosilyticus]UOQ74007.1 hypothetical protein MUN79_08990 [Hymenobacter cellulosilyticus]